MPNGIWEDRVNDVILGHNRLSIVELSEAGAQPMADDSGDWVISYNGELYNHDVLRQELIKSFRSHFAEEVIQKLFFTQLNTLASMSSCEKQMVCLLLQFLTK